jgi:PAS domain S-box-containing protein
VLETGDGNEVLQIVAAERPSVVLLDVLLPGLHGWELLTGLKERPSTADIPVIIVTGRTDRKDQVRAWELGACDVLLKPFSPDDLLTSVRAGLEPDCQQRVDERKQLAMKKLNGSNGEASKLQAIIDSSPDAIASASLDGTILSWNKGAERMYGYSAEEMIGRGAGIVVPPGKEAELKDLFARIAQGEPVIDYETTRVRKDGRQISVSATISPIRDSEGRVIETVAVARDITSHKRTEKLFRNLVENGPDGMVIVDSRGKIQMVNAQTEKLFGYKRDELLGQPVELLVPEHLRDTHASERRAYTQGPHARTMGQDLQLLAVRKDGSQFPVEVSLSPVETEDGLLVAAAVRDVSARKRGEQALEDALKRERAAAQQLRDVDRLKSDFLSTVSHELRTPLTTIKGFSELLSEDWDSFDDSRRRDLVSRICRSALRLDGLISDLLDFTRLERGKVNVELHDTNLLGAVTDTVRKLESSLERHPLKVRIESALTVRADSSALGRVIENLLTNAAKFSPPGSPIAIVAEGVSDSEVVLKVIDRGRGIAKEDANKIFERFYRVNTPEQVYPGTGVGLAIVKEFVEAQGGRVWVESDLGAGSTFCVSLQRAEVEQSELAFVSASLSAKE